MRVKFSSLSGSLSVSHLSIHGNLLKICQVVKSLFMNSQTASFKTCRKIFHGSSAIACLPLSEQNNFQSVFKWFLILLPSTHSQLLAIPWIGLMGLIRGSAKSKSHFQGWHWTYLPRTWLNQRHREHTKQTLTAIFLRIYFLSQSKSKVQSQKD